MKPKIEKLNFHQKGTFIKRGRFLVSEKVCVPIPKSKESIKDEFIDSNNSETPDIFLRK
jgi:hypothetical protein